MQIKSNNKTLDLTTPQVMGIVNTTPDSFSDGGLYRQTEAAVAHAKAMIDAGVSIIDIGGESTRPGAELVSEEEELARVIPVIEAIRSFSSVWISVDTSKAEVMRQAIEAGADLINDVRSLTMPGAMAVAAKAQVPVCIMHMQGQPQTMQLAPQYQDVFQDVEDFLTERVSACEQAGIPRENLILDPGFGFGKTLQHNYHLLANLEKFHKFNLPVLAGMSRKSMIFKLLDKQPSQSMVGSVTCATLAVLKGAQIIRVHDFQETLEAMTIIRTMQENKTS